MNEHPYDLVVAAIEAAMEDAVDHQAPRPVLASLAVAHVHAQRLFNFEPNVIETNHVETKALPPVRKQPNPNHYSGNDVKRPGISKLTKGPRQFACPTCGAEAGTNCFVMTGPGHRSQVTEERREDDWYHSKRAQLAADHNKRVKAKYDREHFVAVQP